MFSSPICTVDWGEHFLCLLRGLVLLRVEIRTFEEDESFGCNDGSFVSAWLSSWPLTLENFCDLVSCNEDGSLLDKQSVGSNVVWLFLSGASYLDIVVELTVILQNAKTTNQQWPLSQSSKRHRQPLFFACHAIFKSQCGPKTVVCCLKE